MTASEQLRRIRDAIAPAPEPDPDDEARQARDELVADVMPRKPDGLVEPPEADWHEGPIGW